MRGKKLLFGASSSLVVQYQHSVLGTNDYFNSFYTNEIFRLRKRRFTGFNCLNSVHFLSSGLMG